MSTGYRFTVCILSVEALEDLAGFYQSQGREEAADAVMAVMYLAHVEYDDRAIECRREFHLAEQAPAPNGAELLADLQAYFEHFGRALSRECAQQIAHLAAQGRRGEAQELADDLKAGLVLDLGE